MAETSSYGCGCGGAPAPAPGSMMMMRPASPMMAYGCGANMKYGGARFRPRSGIMSPLKPKTKKDQVKKRRCARKTRRSAKKATRRHAKRTC